MAELAVASALSAADLPAYQDDPEWLTLSLSQFHRPTATAIHSAALDATFQWSLVAAHQ